MYGWQTLTSDEKKKNWKNTVKRMSVGHCLFINYV